MPTIAPLGSYFTSWRCTRTIGSAPLSQKISTFHVRSSVVSATVSVPCVMATGGLLCCKLGEAAVEFDDGVDESCDDRPIVQRQVTPVITPDRLRDNLADSAS